MPEFPLDPTRNVILVNGLFKGPKGIRLVSMVLDTGASLSSIPFETSLGIGIDPTHSKRRIEIITASGKEILPVVIIPEFSFLGFCLKNVEAVCLNLPSNTRANALLGLNVLKNFDVNLKFKSNLMEINE